MTMNSLPCSVSPRVLADLFCKLVFRLPGKWISPRSAVSSFLLIFVLPAVCQRPLDQRNVTVQVRDASTTPGSPVRGARVAVRRFSTGKPPDDWPLEKR
jgi:hypothetical protein